ncbi:MAG: hypothetical protein JWO30_4673 [Fibrobacteres bacterium]|nr:hypothetical protein [Fibrobacterota bacterium]
MLAMTNLNRDYYVSGTVTGLGPGKRRRPIFESSNNLPHRSFPSLLVFIIHCALLTAFASSNHTVPWKAYETEHFKIVFHEDVRPQADVAKDFLESAYAKIAADLGLRHRDIAITVVLTGIPDESNGYSAFLGHRMVIFTRPFQSLGSGEIAWLKRVLAHELAHEITFLALRKSFWGIYSESYKTSVIPSWFMEGVAQYEAETWDAKRNTFFAHALYNSALEPYPNLATYTKDDPVSARLLYEQGHAFVRFLVARQGKGFLGPLLARVRVIPVWTEIKFVLSPLTASILPLEDALKAKTGMGVKALYREFQDSLKAGLPAGAVAGQMPLLGGVPGFAIVYQMKVLDSTRFLFTGQKEPDQSYTSLYLSERGRVSKIGPDFVHPVFDLSPDHKRVLYVQSYENMDGDPEEKLFVQDLDRGGRRFISNGASDPLFLTPDSIAFSRYGSGRQSVALCGLGARSISCEYEDSDSLKEFYALSKSAKGILMNATDTSGRTGIFEFSPGAGFSRLTEDTVPAEFPMEAGDGSVWMVRDRGGLQQIDALDRATGEFSPVATYPLGTFLLQRADSGTLASVVQTGPAGAWDLQPVAIHPPQPDTEAVDTAEADTGVADTAPAADTVAVYHKPSFLSTPVPEFPIASGPAREVKEYRYHSLLEIRPLIVLPVAFPAFPGAAFGLTAFLQDPLELHTLAVTASPSERGPFYDVAYTNQQTPVGLTLSASNIGESVDFWSPPPGWTEVDLVKKTTDLSLRLRIPAPWSLPRPHSLSLGLGAAEHFIEYRLAGSRNEKSADFLDGWSMHREEFVSQAYLAYSCFRPYAFVEAHPLLATVLEGGAAFILPERNPVYFWYARQTVPLWRELTITALYKGQAYDLDFQNNVASLPDGQSSRFHPGGEQGIDHDVYGGLDFPLYKGYIGEWPILGLLNYLGGTVYGSYGQADFDENPYFGGSRIDRRRGIAGAKLNALFHFMRKSPIVLSLAYYYDFVDKDPAFAVRLNYFGIPSAYSLFPGHRAGLGEARNYPVYP